MSTAVTPRRATPADLLRVDGKAELVNGQVIELIPTGHRPNLVAGRIFRKLADHVDTMGVGVAYTDNMGFNIPILTSFRESFSPDASYYTGPLPADPMRFVDGPPDFAVEVRSVWDYGPTAEQDMADKRADYFEAGTRVVWELDPISRLVRRYRPGEPTPTEFAAGDTADAEPAVPGWRVAVDWLMR